MSFTKANRTVLDLNKATVNLPSEPYQLANKKYVDDKFADSVTAPVAVEVASATQTTTAGQTVVITPTYRPNTKTLFVFLDGVYQRGPVPEEAPADNKIYSEATADGNGFASSITFVDPLPAGIRIDVIVLNAGDRVGGSLALDDLSDVDTNLTLSSMPSSGKMLVLDGLTWKTISVANVGKTYQAGSYLNLNSGGTFSVKTSGSGGLDELYVRQTQLASYSLTSHNHDSTYIKLDDSWTTTQWINGHSWYWPGWSATGAVYGVPGVPNVISSLPAKPGNNSRHQYVRQMFPGGFFIESGTLDGHLTGGTYTPGGLAGTEVCVVTSFVACECCAASDAPATSAVPLVVCASAANFATTAPDGGVTPTWNWTPANKRVTYIATGVIKPSYTTISNTKSNLSAPNTLKDQKYPTGTSAATLGLQCY
jgi:hypothetical protein